MVSVLLVRSDFCKQISPNSAKFSPKNKFRQIRLDYPGV